MTHLPRRAGAQGPPADRGSASHESGREVPKPGALLRELALTIGEADSLDEGFEIVLERICAATRWHLGQAWTPEPDSEGVLSSRAIHVAAPGLERFVELSQVHRFQPGRGLPGRVWETRRPIWLHDVRTDRNFARADAAAQTGIVAAIGVPVLDRREPVAVLEFFMLEERDHDAELLDVVSAAAAQLGALVRRRRVEEVARRTEERFRTVAETARDSIITAGDDGHITYVNEAAERTFGYGSGELLGKPLVILMPESLRDAHRAGLARYVATREGRVIGHAPVELEGLRKDGEVFPIELSLATWASEGRTFFTGIIRDITERKRAEAELRRLYEMKGQFIAQAAHELRTPLTILAGLLKTLAERRSEVSEQQLGEFFEILSFQSTRVLGLVDGLLDVSRLEQEAPNETLERIELEPIVHRALEAAPPPDGWDVQVAIPRGLEALADASRLEGVLVNLLINAYRYGASPVLIEAAARGERAVLAVEDAGPGVAEDVADHLFEPFTRAVAVQNIEGSGLGLTIVRQAVELMGGTTRYVRTRAGARFEVDLRRRS